MIPNLLVGIGAGLVSALLIAVVAAATPLALFLYLLAPLPILIVALGWSHRAGLVATAAGALALAVALSPLRGLAFAVATALPAWWLAYLTLLGRAGANGAMEWYPLGRLLAWIAATSAIVLTAAAVLSPGGYEAFRGRTQEIVQALIEIRPGPGEDAAQAQALERQVASRLAPVVPALAAQGLTVLMTLYLWAAARIVQVSQRLPRPWPDLPATAMPRRVVWILAASLVAAFLPGFLGVFGAALTGGLALCFALQGLAAIHDRTRGRPGRGAILFGLYLVVALTQGIALVMLSLLGLVDSIRGRRPAANAA